MGEQSINKGSSVAMFLIPRRQWWAFDQPEWDAGAQQANRFPLLFIKTLLDAVPTCTCGRGLNLRDLKCYFFLFSVLNLHVCADVPLAKTSRFSYHEANIHLWKTMDFVGLLMSCVCLPWVYFYLHAHAGAPGRKGWTRLRGKNTDGRNLLFSFIFWFPTVMAFYLLPAMSTCDPICHMHNPIETTSCN